ncbi:Carbonic anhydrase 2 [Clarias magur]|uniref:Carbonic anhydrase 2 n=1 Tax=Clarias magur TaxID=1594786 RepID=A0A8J4XE91_CLAMG|nr:Carbonic anhydrase 2 [Clarias magur]
MSGLDYSLHSVCEGFRRLMSLKEWKSGPSDRPWAWVKEGIVRKYNAWPLIVVLFQLGVLKASRNLRDRRHGCSFLRDRPT